MTRESPVVLLLDCLPELHAYVCKIAHNRQIAVELLQEVSVRILSGEGPPDRERFVAWCCGIARHVLAGDWRRRKRTDASLALGGEALEMACGRTFDLEAQLDARAWLTRAMAVLGPEAFELLTRRYLLEESAVELADELAQSSAALRMRLMRLRSVILRTCPRVPVPRGPEPDLAR
jgi:DNA-directed RNA polymerase specialized sigma24 family protein